MLERDLRFELTVDLGVGPIADGCELVGDRRIDARVIAGVLVEIDAHGREELGVGDVLLLGGKHTAGDLELQLLVEVIG